MPRNRLMQAALEQSAEGFLAFCPNGRLLLCNRAAARGLGVHLPALRVDATLDELLAESSALDQVARARLQAVVKANGAGQDLREGADPYQIILSPERVMQATVSRHADDGILVRITVQATGFLPAERMDSLTGLSDRQWFRQRLNSLLADSAGAEQVAVLMIDLDRFKAVNDSHGHPVGDALLQLAAQRLRSAVRDGDVVSRLGGDEFGVVMPTPAHAEATGARLVDLLSRPYLIEEHVATIGASIGIAIGPRDGSTAADLVRAADLALYQAKEEGRRAVRMFDQDMDARARARSTVENDLRRALALRQFEVHYQPQTDLAHGALVGFEALVRWRHPEQGMIPPDKFIPLAEELGLIVPLGEWVLRTACCEAARWPEHLSVAVNVSAKQLVDRHRLPRMVAAALADAGLPGRRLEVEITESALVRHQQEALHVLHALHAMGVRVSMDDFGTGYSSLSQLRTFPFDKLKIDRSFVRDLSASAEAVAVVRAIAALGASMGMTTTAEGVETSEQEAIIRADGCTHMQGYLVSRPVPSDELGALIERLGAPTNTVLEATP